MNEFDIRIMKAESGRLQNVTIKVLLYLLYYTRFSFTFIDIAVYYSVRFDKCTGCPRKLYIHAGMCQQCVYNFSGHYVLVSKGYFLIQTANRAGSENKMMLEQLKRYKVWSNIEVNTYVLIALCCGGQILIWLRYSFWQNLRLLQIYIFGVRGSDIPCELHNLR